MMSMLRGVVDSTAAECFSASGGTAEGEAVRNALARFEGVYFLKGACVLPEGELTTAQFADAVYDTAVKFYEQKEAYYGASTMREIERVVMLRVVDEYWMDNICRRRSLLRPCRGR